MILCGVTMAPVTPPAHHPTRPPVVSQQEAGQDRRARWWAGGGRGHCGRGFATGCCLGARDRCKMHNTSRQHRGGGEKGGGTNQAKPQTDRNRHRTRSQKPGKKTNTNKNRQAIWPTEKQKPKKTSTGKTRGGRPRRVQEVDEGEERVEVDCDELRRP